MVLRAGKWLFSLALLGYIFAWVAVVDGWVRPSPAIRFVVAGAGAAVAALMAVAGLYRVRAIRRLGARGLATTATVEKVTEQYVHVPYGYTGWVTGVTVSFVDTEGETVRASYTDHARAGGKRVGQPLLIAYDPDRPDSISPLDTRGEPNDPRYIEVFLLGVGIVGCLAMAGWVLVG